MKEVKYLAANPQLYKFLKNHYLDTFPLFFKAITVPFLLLEALGQVNPKQSKEIKKNQGKPNNINFRVIMLMSDSLFGLLENKKYNTR